MRTTKSMAWTDTWHILCHLSDPQGSRLSVETAGRATARARAPHEACPMWMSFNSLTRRSQVCRISGSGMRKKRTQKRSESTNYTVTHTMDGTHVLDPNVT